MLANSIRVAFNRVLVRFNSFAPFRFVFIVQLEILDQLA